MGGQERLIASHHPVREAMAAVVAYAFDQIDQARAQLQGAD